MLPLSKTVVVVMLVATVACAQSPASTTGTPGPDGAARLFPDVISVVVTEEAGGTYRFDVTISSPYDNNNQYADAWRVISNRGDVYGVRELTHPHANEQPFTRSLTGVEIPPGVNTVTVEGRDLLNGWGGETLAVDIP